MEQLSVATLTKALYKAGQTEGQVAVEIIDDDQTIVAYFDQGSLVHTHANVSGDLLGRNLVSKQRLTENRYGEAAKMAIESGISISDALIESGLISREELIEELGQEALERVVARFGSRGGSIAVHMNRPSPEREPKYRIPAARIVVDGLTQHATEDDLNGLVQDVNNLYFKLRTTADDVTERFSLSPNEHDFLRHSGRAYNVADAAEMSGLNDRDAKILITLLTNFNEVSAFTPGVQEFEVRLREERSRSQIGPASQRPQEATLAPSFVRDAQTRPLTNRPITADIPLPHEEFTSRPGSALGTAPLSPPGGMLGRLSPANAPAGDSFRGSAPSISAQETLRGQSNMGIPESLRSPPNMGAADPLRSPANVAPDLRRGPPPPPPDSDPALASVPPLPSYIAPPMPPGAPTVQFSSVSVGETEAPLGRAMPPRPPMNASIPPMPTPPRGQMGSVPRPVVFSPPLPRGPDGSPQETPERSRSREHFQRGVTLLGQGNFDEAEDFFREAIALCSEEHVYLIGLARAIYYNPVYGALGKVPVLRSIVDRAQYLAPDDARVTTLNDWVRSAETTL